MSLSQQQIKILRYLSENEYLYRGDYAKFDNTKNYKIISSLLHKKLIEENTIVVSPGYNATNLFAKQKIWITPEGTAVLEEYDKAEKEQKRKERIESQNARNSSNANVINITAIIIAALSLIVSIVALLK
jgi:hypothetical protein